MRHLYTLALGAVVLAACGGGTNGGDGAQDGATGPALSGDAAQSADAATSGHGHDLGVGEEDFDLAAGGTGDAATSQAADAAVGAATSLVLAATTATGTVNARLYANGTWGTPTGLAANAVVGGTAVTADGPFVSMTDEGDSSAVVEIRPNATWVSDSDPDPFGMYSVLSTSNPVATSAGVAIAYQTSSGTVYAESADPEWSVDAPANLIGGTAALALARTDAGDPFLVGYGAGPVGSSTYGYNSTTRSNGTWSASASVWSGEDNETIYRPGIALAPLIGKDSVVAVFLTGDDGGAETLRLSTFSSGAWSGALTISASMDAGGSFSLASLPDGRVALAYITTQNDAVNVGFWDGTAWNTSNHAPSVGATAVAIAPGATGATLELAFIRGDSVGNVAALWHTRLLDETDNIWSVPLELDHSLQYRSVSIAEGP